MTPRPLALLSGDSGNNGTMFLRAKSRFKDGKEHRYWSRVSLRIIGRLIIRSSASKRFTAEVAAFKEWLKKSRTLKTKELWGTAKAKLRGHYAYNGVTDNMRGIARFAYEVKNLLFKWLNRRGRRGCLNWGKFNRMLELFPLPVPRIKVSMFKTR